MNTAIVIGNGISRQDVNLDRLKKLGKTYGCNALYREFTPDVLVATDRPISAEIQNSGYAQQNIFYTRRPLEGLGAHRVLECYYGYSSGPNATALAAHHGARRVYLLGFDMGPTLSNQFNNIYAGTEFYKPASAQPTYTGNWIKQLITIMKDYSTVEFVRLYGQTTAKITEFDTLSNLQHQELSTLIDRINNAKDL